MPIAAYKNTYSFYHWFKHVYCTHILEKAEGFKPTTYGSKDFLNKLICVINYAVFIIFIVLTQNAKWFI